MLLFNRHPYYWKYQPNGLPDLQKILEKKELEIPGTPVFQNKNLVPLLTGN